MRRCDIPAVSKQGQEFQALMRGDAEQLAGAALVPNSERLVRWLLWIAVGCAIYGSTFGLWRSPTQALFTGIKFPLVVLLTCGGNAVLNGCLAMALGSGLGFKQSVLAILMSFTVMGIVLLSVATLMLFLLWNTPSVDSPDLRDVAIGKSIVILAHVAAIGVAGVIGNCRLWQTLRHITGSPQRAYIVLISWLAGNLLLGSQICWILRPWIGTPNGGAMFLSPTPFEGNFFEAVWTSLSVLLFKQHN